MVQVLPAVKVPLIGLFQKTFHGLGRIPLPHKDVLLVDDGIVRKQADGTAQGAHNAIVAVFVTAENGRKL